MASSSDTVPPTLLEKYNSGSRMDSPTALCAAKCTTASTPSSKARDGVGVLQAQDM